MPHSSGNSHSKQLYWTEQNLFWLCKDVQNVVPRRNKGFGKKKEQIGQEALKRMIKQNNASEWDTNGLKSDDES